MRVSSFRVGMPRSVAVSAVLVSGWVLVASACGRGGHGETGGSSATVSTSAAQGSTGSTSTSIAASSTTSTAQSSSSSSTGITCPPAASPVLVAAGNPWHIAVDSVSVYWTDTNNGRVGVAPLCGGNASYIAQQQESPNDITLDDTYVSWTNQGTTAFNGAIMRRPKSVGGPSVLAKNQSIPMTVLTDVNGTYWGGLWFLPTGAATPSHLGNFGAYARMAQDVDYIYFATSTVGRTRKVGGQTDVFLTNSQPSGWCTAVDNRSIYWTTYVGPLLSMPKTGGAVTTLAPAGPMRCLAVDDTYAYWIEDLAGVKRVPKTGGPVTTIASMPTVVMDVAVDTSNVYFGAADGVYRVSK